MRPGKNMFMRFTSVARLRESPGFAFSYHLAFGQCDAFRRSAMASPGGVFNHTVVVAEKPEPLMQRFVALPLAPMATR